MHIVDKKKKNTEIKDTIKLNKYSQQINNALFICPNKSIMKLSYDNKAS